MIIAVSGGIGAGKSALTAFFNEKGFESVSLSDILRNILRENNQEINRENLRAKGDELREKHGKAALAIMAWENMKNSLNKNWIIESIISVEEAEFFKEKGATIIGITAPEKLRYERANPRGRDNFKSFEHFKEKDLKKRNLGIDKIIQNSDILIQNDGSLEELKEMVNSIFMSISSYHE